MINRSNTQPTRVLPVSLAALLVTGVAVILVYLNGLGHTYLRVPSETLLIPDQTAFQSDGQNRQAVAFLAKRWGVGEDRIYMIVQDSRPWMRIICLLDVQLLSSARLWILDMSHPEGRRWAAQLARQNTPHDAEIYLVREYRPRETDKEMVREFYKTKTLGGLAIIEDVRWTDAAHSSGFITAYQSQRYLPSLTVPIVDGKLQKELAYQTPVD